MIEELNGLILRKDLGDKPNQAPIPIYLEVNRAGNPPYVVIIITGPTDATSFLPPSLSPFLREGMSNVPFAVGHVTDQPTDQAALYGWRASPRPPRGGRGSSLE